MSIRDLFGQRKLVSAGC